MRVLLTFLFLFFQVAISPAQDLKAKVYLYKMLDAISRVKTATYTLTLHERVPNKFRDSEFKVKLDVNPFKLYALSNHPNPGAEALLIDGKNNMKALINPNRFPYVNLCLSPQCNLLRKNHHYTFNEIGFSYIQKILTGYLRNDSVTFYKTLHFYENIAYAGQQYYMLEMDYPSYSFVDYTVKEGETLTTIADKLLVNDYKILISNPKLSYYDDVKPGQVIKVPNAFARKIVLYLDKTTMLPLIQTVYDEQGLFGRYEIHNFNLNPVFAPDEFTETYAGYHF